MASERKRNRTRMRSERRGEESGWKRREGKGSEGLKAGRRRGSLSQGGSRRPTGTQSKYGRKGAQGKATRTRVAPEEVAQEALVRHVRRPHDPPDLLHRLQVRRQSCTRNAVESTSHHITSHLHFYNTNVNAIQYNANTVQNNTYAKPIFVQVSVHGQEE